jgi:hypothetical protein
MTDAPRDLVAELVAEGRLERIARDQSAVQRTLAQASMNLQGAERELQAGNAGGAYALLWDGLRQSIAAHMTSQGLRATSRPGHHAALIIYATARLATRLNSADLAALDRIRRTRNRGEYEAEVIPITQVGADIAIGRRIAQVIIRILTANP